MLSKLAKRERRKVKTRAIIRKSGRPRICIYRSLKHFYAQLIVFGEKGDRVLASASSLDKTFRQSGVANNVELARKIGKGIAEKTLALNIKKVALDRSGYQYHTRLKGFKESAEAVGLEF